ncbi:hypothetical protein ACFP3I_08085 [Chryseobacterium arachidis]|uniref:FEKKY domain-containing protein n=1 Tax=Chryseobacterium arachidis TaxID=1416778 RepID=UPI0011602744
MFIVILTFSCETKEETMIHEDGYYRILGFGFSNMEREKLQAGIIDKWKIKHVDVAGCVVTEKLMDSIKTENQKTFAALEKRYGKDWRTKYENDLSHFAMNQVEVMDVLITNKLFRNELKKNDIEIDDVDKNVKELDEGLYKVVVYNQKLKAENKECFSVQVNTKERTVNLIK